MNNKQNILDLINQYEERYKKKFNEKQRNIIVHYLLNNPEEKANEFIRVTCELHLSM